MQPDDCAAPWHDSVQTRWLLGGASALAVLAALPLLFLRPAADGLQAYPHAFLAEPGYDPSLITCLTAPIEAPPPAPSDLAPAWQCNDSAFNDAQARPWLFPLPVCDTLSVPPLHPQLRRRPDLSRCQLYRSPEALRQLASYREGYQP